MGGLALSALIPTGATAHDIPTDVTIRIIVRPADERLDVLVRVPLEAMRDITFPTVGPGYLDIERAQESLENAAMLWLAKEIELREDGRPLGPLRLVAARASIPSDRSFVEFEAAIDHVLGPPLPAGTPLVWPQALLDVAFQASIESDRSAFSIRPGLERLGLKVTSVIRFEPPTGPARIYQIVGKPELVQLDPRWHQAAARFVAAGFEHILDGADHLLFLFCLVLPFRRDIRALVLIVTAFTVAHSVTLIGSAYGLAPDRLWFTPLIETLIAASILYMAVENLFSARLRTRWIVAFGFGLVHGFGFSFALRNTLQFAGDHVLISLLSFNIGVEVGQLLVLALLVPGLNLAFRLIPHERVAVIVLSVIIGHTAWHWMTDRLAVLMEFPVRWTDLASAAGL
jgi:hypothetical protein